MKKTKDTPETLEAALKELMQHVRAINELEKKIDEAWGVKLVVTHIPGTFGESQGEIVARRGLEEIENALGGKAKQDNGIIHLKELRHYGVCFRQYADEKTRVFVKAWKEPPKVVIVEE